MIAARRCKSRTRVVGVVFGGIFGGKVKIMRDLVFENGSLQVLVLAYLQAEFYVR